MHHLVDGVVCFMLKWIIGLTDSELRLYDSWPWRCAEPGSCLRLVGPVGRKQGDPAEVPRNAARCLSDRRVLRSELLVMIAAGPVFGRACSPPRPKPHHRLIAHRALEQEVLLEGQ